MELTAPGKLAAIIVILLGSFVFIIANTVASNGTETAPAWATITLVCGYLIGNGLGAKRGQSSGPVWTTAPISGASNPAGPASNAATVNPDRGDG